MKRWIRLGVLAVVVVGSVALLLRRGDGVARPRSKHPVAQVEAEGATRHPVVLGQSPRPEASLPAPTGSMRRVRLGGVDRLPDEADWRYERRLRYRAKFLEWVEMNHLTQEQVEATLQILADAQQNFRASQDEVIVGSIEAGSEQRSAQASGDPGAAARQAEAEDKRRAASESQLQILGGEDFEAEVVARLVEVVGEDAAKNFGGRFYRMFGQLLRSGLVVVESDP